MLALTSAPYVDWSTWQETINVVAALCMPGSRLVAPLIRQFDLLHWFSSQVTFVHAHFSATAAAEAVKQLVEVLEPAIISALFGDAGVAVEAGEPIDRRPMRRLFSTAKRSEAWTAVSFFCGLFKVLAEVEALNDESLSPTLWRLTAIAARAALAWFSRPNDRNAVPVPVAVRLQQALAAFKKNQTGAFKAREPETKDKSLAVDLAAMVQASPGSVATEAAIKCFRSPSAPSSFDLLFAEMSLREELSWLSVHAMLSKFTLPTAGQEELRAAVEHAPISQAARDEWEKEQAERETKDVEEKDDKDVDMGDAVEEAVVLDDEAEDDEDDNMDDEEEA